MTYSKRSFIQNNCYRLFSGSLLTVFILLTVSSCNTKTDKITVPEEKIAAKVFDNYLYEKDIAHLFDSSMDPKDSILIRKSFVDDWIKKQLVFEKALQNLTDDQKDKNTELSAYYHSLITYEYEKKIVEQKLNKKVSEEEISDYYEENKSTFQLNRCIIRLIFVKVSQKAPDLRKVKRWYQSEKIEDRDMLHQYCIGNAEKFFLDDKQWFYFDDIVNEVPLESNLCSSHYVQPNIEINDSLSTYFVSIKEYRKAGTTAPIEFEKERIRQMILHKRRIELINSMEEQIFGEALEKNYFTIYE